MAARPLFIRQYIEDNFYRNWLTEFFVDSLEPDFIFFLEGTTESVIDWRYQYSMTRLPIGSPGDSLLHIAIKFDLLNVATWLMQKGLSPDTTSDWGATPLYVASSRELQDMVELLLKFKADPNIGTRANDTPLHCANSPKIIELLLAAGARADVSNGAGQSPLLLAYNTNNTEKIVLLHAAGAKIDVAENGNSDIHQACFASLNVSVQNMLHAKFDGYIAEQEEKKNIL